MSEADCAAEGCSNSVKLSVHAQPKFSCHLCQRAYCSYNCQKASRRCHQKPGICRERLRHALRNRFIQMFMEDASMNTIFWFRSFAYNLNFWKQDWEGGPQRVLYIRFESPAQIQELLQLSNPQHCVDAFSQRLSWSEVAELGIQEQAKTVDPRCGFMVVVDDGTDSAVMRVPVLNLLCPEEERAASERLPGGGSSGSTSLASGLCLTLVRAGPEGQHGFLWSWLQEHPSEWLQMALFDSNGSLLYGEEKGISTEEEDILKRAPLRLSSCSLLLQLWRSRRPSGAPEAAVI